MILTVNVPDAGSNDEPLKLKHLTLTVSAALTHATNDASDSMLPLGMPKLTTSPKAAPVQLIVSVSLLCGPIEPKLSVADADSILLEIMYPFVSTLAIS